MKKYKIGICASFGGAEKTYDGQTVKTKNIYKLLSQKIGNENVLAINTHGWRKKTVKTFANCFKMAKSCESILLMPAQNGVLVLLPLFVILKLIFKNKLSYLIVGGWLAEYTKKHRWLLQFLKRTNGNYAETTTLKKQLEELGLNNSYVLPNYKDLEPLEEEEIKYVKELPVKLCTFSRVMEKKGIEDAMRLVCEINESAGREIVNLDIYGQVDREYNDRFFALLNELPEYISYKGSADPEKSVEVLKEYAIQLFPTKFPTEGIPGSILDSYFAGVPVVASKWNNFSDIIDDGVVGLGFEFGSYEDFKAKVTEFLNDFDKINYMKKNCIKKAISFKETCIEMIYGYFVD